MLKMGLVMSGGGVKGLYHLGVMQYLKEQGIDFEVISATSAGSMVGVLISLGLEPKAIKDELLRTTIKTMPPLWSVFGKSGLIDPVMMKEMVQKRLLNDEQLNCDFTDIEIDLHISTTNMEKGEKVVFSKKNRPNVHLLDAMMASSAYPFMFSPMEIEGVKYSDGGILSNFPAEVVYGECNYLFGVYLSPISEIEGKDLESSKAVVMRALSLIGQDEHSKFSMCNDVLYEKDLSNYQTFNFDKKAMKELYDLGYRSMEKNKDIVLKMKKIQRYKTAFKTPN